MDIIELDDSFAQPRAILFVSADDIFNEDLYRKKYPDVDDTTLGWGWVPVINVVLMHDVKRTLVFYDQAVRDLRFAQILEQMKNA